MQAVTSYPEKNEGKKVTCSQIVKISLSMF